MQNSIESNKSGKRTQLPVPSRLVAAMWGALKDLSLPQAPVESGELEASVRFEAMEPRVLLSADLMPVSPQGSMVYEARDAIHLDAGGLSSGDFQIDMHLGQNLALQVQADTPDFVAQVQVLDTTGAELISQTSSAGGAGIVLNNVFVREAGTYTVRVQALAGASDVHLQLLGNAIFEQEAATGQANNLQAHAESLESSTVSLGGAQIVWQYAALLK